MTETILNAPVLSVISEVDDLTLQGSPKVASIRRSGFLYNSRGSQSLSPIHSIVVGDRIFTLEVTTVDNTIEHERTNTVKIHVEDLSPDGASKTLVDSIELDSFRVYPSSDITEVYAYNIHYSAANDLLVVPVIHTIDENTSQLYVYTIDTKTLDRRVFISSNIYLNPAYAIDFNRQRDLRPYITNIFFSDDNTMVITSDIMEPNQEFQYFETIEARVEAFNIKEGKFYLSMTIPTLDPSSGRAYPISLEATFGKVKAYAINAVNPNISGNTDFQSPIPLGFELVQYDSSVSTTVPVSITLVPDLFVPDVRYLYNASVQQPRGSNGLSFLATSRCALRDGYLYISMDYDLVNRPFLLCIKLSDNTAQVKFLVDVRPSMYLVPTPLIKVGNDIFIASLDKIYRVDLVEGDIQLTEIFSLGDYASGTHDATTGYGTIISSLLYQNGTMKVVYNTVELSDDADWFDEPGLIIH